MLPKRQDATDYTAPDIDEAEWFLTLLAEDELVTFQTFDEGEARKRRSLAYIYHGRLNTHATILTSLGSIPT